MQPPAWAPTLTDGEVTLRAHHPDDVDAVLAQGRDPQMQRWTAVPRPYERRHAEEFVAERQLRWVQRESLAFAIDTRAGFAGTVDLHRLAGDGAELGYALVPAARGHGISVRALRLLLPWAFEEVGLRTVVWRATVGNWASRRVAWSIGFRVGDPQPVPEPRRDETVQMWVGRLGRGEPMQPAHPWYTPSRLTAPDGTVLLRPHDAAADLDRLVAACADPDTARWLSGLPAPYTVEDGRHHLQRVVDDHAAGRAVHWAVADAADGRFLGQVSLFRLDTGQRSGEIGYLAHPDERGRGVITSSVRLVARHALLPEPDGGLGLDRVWLVADAPNAASMRVAAKAGLRRAGTDRAAGLMRDGTRCDQIRFDLLADELESPG
jgi:RimJ/RimL family protein N-acetyltransferase